MKSYSPCPLNCRAQVRLVKVEADGWSGYLPALYICIAGGAGAVPDEVGGLFHGVR